jgi:hypothetical protein
VVFSSGIVDISSSGPAVGRFGWGHTVGVLRNQARKLPAPLGAGGGVWLLGARPSEACLVVGRGGCGCVV